LSKYVDAPPAGTYRLAAQIVPVPPGYLMEPLDDSEVALIVAALEIPVGENIIIETKTTIAEGEYAHFVTN
jgi:hypothetical protein